MPRFDDPAAVAFNGPLGTISITFGVVALSLIVYFSLILRGTSINFPVVKSPKSAAARFGQPTAPESMLWPRLLAENAEKFRSPFVIKFPGLDTTTILPLKYTDDIKNNKDMSFDAVTKRDFFPSYPGFDAMKAGLSSHAFNDAVRIKLTQALGSFTQDLSDEANIALQESLPGQNGKWTPMVVYPTALSLVTRLSSLIFIGRGFDRIEEWKEITASYAINVFNAARVLRQWKPWLRPVVHWFLPETTKLRVQVKLARSIIEPEVDRRRQIRQAALRIGTQPKKSLDSVDWFEETAKGQKFDFAGGELLLSLVAIHTTTATLTNTLLDICAQPELVTALREEIAAVIRKDDGLQRTSLHKLKLMDSVMKESQRLHPLGYGALRRYVVNDVKLHDGTILPKGSYIMSGPLLNFDAEIFPKPYEFDGYRFLKLRQRPGEENKWQFVTTQIEHLSFGHGMHACPGRFFASNELKISLIHLLLKYDWRFPLNPSDGKPSERPESLEMGWETPPNPTAVLEYMARKPEVEF